MSKLKKIGYELRDVAVIQAPISYINHRGEADPFVEICDRKVYPIFVAPMASVTDEKNYKVWIDNQVTPVVPRSVGQNISFEERMKIAEETFVSISLLEARNHLMDYLDHQSVEGNVIKKLYICIDIAHGTLSDLYSICRFIKYNYGDKIEIMTGNVANPEAYSFYADCGVDWLRLSIGTGSRCTSSCNVSIHYPSATLLDNMNEERKKYAHSHNGKTPTKIILDGGIGWFDDIQKALCLGADAVMCGKLFAQAEEACGEVILAENVEACMNGNYVSKEALDKAETSSNLMKCLLFDTPMNELKPFREYYGMSTKRAQKETGGTGNRTSEGISRPVAVEYPIAKWIDNMQSYLRSCMTYTNSHTIKEMQENAQVIILGGSGDASYRK